MKEYSAIKKTEIMKSADKWVKSETILMRYPKSRKTNKILCVLICDS